MVSWRHSLQGRHVALHQATCRKQCWGNAWRALQLHTVPSQTLSVLQIRVRVYVERSKMSAEVQLAFVAAGLSRHQRFGFTRPVRGNRVISLYQE